MDPMGPMGDHFAGFGDAHLRLGALLRSIHPVRFPKRVTESPTSDVLDTSNEWCFSKAATCVHIDHGTTSPISCHVF